MISAIFLVLAFFLACLFGSTTDEWSWGPAMMALAVSLMAAVVVVPPRHSRVRVPVFVWGMVAVAFGYLALRAWFSPVRGLAAADWMLLALCGGSFLVCALQGSWKRFVTVLAFGLALLVAANAVVALLQLRDPGFSVLPGHHISSEPSGFFPHRNYFANFQLGVGLWLAGLALLGAGGQARWLRIAAGGAALLALISVPLSQSRGGVVALGVGMVVLVVLWVFLVSRRGDRSSAWLLLAAPVGVVLLAVGAFATLGHVQGERKEGSGVEQTMSEAGRFQYAQKALEGALKHPLFGGGSRSVSWENYQYWNRETNGYVFEDLVFAHNEPVQTLADYGVAGFLLVLVSTATLLTIGLIRLWGGAGNQQGGAAGMIVGCLAASVAMLTQCQFSFVFHLAPGAMWFGGLMGFLAGAGAPLEKREAGGVGPVQRVVRAGALLLALAMVWPGVRAVRALYAFAHAEPGRPGSIDALLARAHALDEAVSAWKTPAMLLSQGRAWYRAAVMEENPKLRAGRFDRAIHAYAEAEQLHPYDPQIAVNYALALSQIGREKEADEEFQRAIELQCDLEGAFHAQYFFGQELYRRGWRMVMAKQYGEASKALEQARVLIDAVMEDDYKTRMEARKIRLMVARTLAEAYLKLGREDDALDELKTAAVMPGTRSFHYYVALEMFRRGEKVWYARKPEEALRWFTDALTELRRTGGKYPEEVNPETAAKLSKQIESRIKFLKGAGIQLPPKKSE